MLQILSILNNDTTCTDIRYGFRVKHYPLETAFEAVKQNLVYLSSHPFPEDLVQDAVLMFLNE